MSTEPIIRLEGVHKAFGSKVVLKNASFEVRRGEMIVILGASGSGKSVTLKHVDGLLRPDAGVVETLGYRVSEMEERALYPVRKRVAYLFQGGALFDSMTVFDNVAFPLREHRDLDRDELARQVNRLLELVELPGTGHLMPSELSGGMKKRIALARALALEPEIVLYDEPTTGLDPVTGRTIAELMRDLHARLGVTSLTVTHDMPLVRRVATRVLFLSGGRFIFSGSVEEASREAPEEVRAFFEEPGGGHA